MEDLGASIQAFGERCPLVTNFEVTDQPEAHCVDTILDLIRHWQNLSFATCYTAGLNTNALSHLSCLHNLLYLAFKVHDRIVDRIHATQTSPFMLIFLTLHELHLCSHRLAPVWRLLRHFHFKTIRRLSVHLEHHPTAPDLMSFYVAIQEALTCHDSLYRLGLHVHNLQSNPPPYCITFDCLCPLTVFMDIKNIRLNVASGADLNEHELLCLASSWPQLETFKVTEDYDWTSLSAITPGGFLQLLELCKSLRLLCFPFDIRGYTNIPQGHPWWG